MKPTKLIQRFLIPGPLVTVLAWWKFRCKISPRAEVELTRHLRIGRKTQIGSFTKLKATRGPLEMGSEVHVGAGCFISAGEAGVRIGDYCMISPRVSIVGTSYRYDRLDIPILHQERVSSGIEIGDNVWLGTGAVVMDGASVGEGVIVTPNSVVSGRVPENSIVQGNPAKVIFTRR